jgi:DNA-binding response OmpR family regulator
MRILVVDDDVEVTSHIREIVSRRGHSCVTLRTGAGLLAELRRETFDLLLLDWNLPDTSGLDLLQSIRAMPMAIGIIMLTSRSGEEDITRALHAGADDYIVKPESEQIIVARIEAALRRTVPAQAPSRLVVFGAYAFDRLTETVRIDDEPVAMSAKEFALALLFFENMHRAMSRGYILEALWHSVADLPTRTLDMHVSRVRSKLRLRPENGYRIVALSGYGYRMECFPIGSVA